LKFSLLNLNKQRVLVKKEVTASITNFLVLIH
jgi:hypothetical protein